MVEAVKLPFPWITGLTHRQQFEIWRDFQALQGQFSIGTTAATLPANVRAVAVGRNGKLATSPDGITWTARTSSFGTSTIYDVVWSPQLRLFVSVGAGGKIATSNAGLTWAQQTTPTANDLLAVTWAASLGLFVAVGNTGTVVTSVDGSHWTLHSSTSFTTNNIGYITWSPTLGIFVATGGLGLIATSPDGVNWTQRTHPFTGYPHGVAWNAVLQKFHTASGAGGTTQHGYSTDGITWVAWATNPTDTSVGSAGFEAPDVALIATGGENGHIDTSPDGTTWTSTALAGIGIITDLDRSQALDLNLLVGYNFGATQGYIFTSPNGTTWTSRSVPFADALEGCCAADLS